MRRNPPAAPAASDDKSVKSDDKSNEGHTADKGDKAAKPAKPAKPAKAAKPAKPAKAAKPADIISTVTFEEHAPTLDSGLTVSGPATVFVGGDPASGAFAGPQSRPRSHSASATCSAAPPGVSSTTGAAASRTTEANRSASMRPAPRLA